MRRRHDARALRAHRLDDRDRERRALNRIGARAELVDENQAAVVRKPQNADDVRHVRGERRERLLDALLVANVGEHVAEYRDLAAVRRGDHQAAHRHQRQEARCFERDRLAAGVRAGHDQRVKVAAEHEIGRHDLVFVDQRVTRRFDIHAARVVQLRHNTFHLIGELSLCEDQVQLHRRAVALHDAVGKLAHLARKLRQNAVDFVLLVRA